LVLLSGEQNRRLLCDVLSDRYDVTASIEKVDADSSEGPFDLCMIDGPSLALHQSWLAAIRRKYDPLYFPVVLLLEKNDTGRLPRTFWEIADDVLLRPVDRIELATRVQSLLRTRAMSLRAQKAFGLYEQEARIARRLQAAALPNAFPSIPNVRFSGFYQPADVDAKVGGDWYDVLRLADGRIVISVGDVAGSGLDAAVTMGKLRQVVRAVAQLHTDPAHILDATDEALQVDEPGRYVTAFIGILDPIEGRFDYASAGHPMPVMRRPDGNLEKFAAAGLLLGTGIRETRVSSSIACDEGSIFVLYTDGLTEATHNVLEGEERLEIAVRTMRIEDYTDAAKLVFTSVVEDVANDDTAVLVIMLVPEENNETLSTFCFDSAEVTSVRKVQKAITEKLSAGKYAAETIAACELAFIELVGNSVRYASGEVKVILDTSQPASILHVLDRGPGFTYIKTDTVDYHKEGGRGLYIIAALADRFYVNRRIGGGSHARVVLPQSSR
jgi:serine phosphatase RsbU (regulator of sigma subunit)/anti-sigma regulatory factor (Ser/Thr protein kinase)